MQARGTQNHVGCETHYKWEDFCFWSVHLTPGSLRKNRFRVFKFWNSWPFPSKQGQAALNSGDNGHQYGSKNFFASFYSQGFLSFLTLWFSIINSLNDIHGGNGDWMGNILFSGFKASESLKLTLPWGLLRLPRQLVQEGSQHITSHETFPVSELWF